MTLLKELRKAYAEKKLRTGKLFQDHDLIFCKEDGTPMSIHTLRHRYDKVRAACQTKLRFHDLRHTHATQLLKAEIDPKLGAERLGHSSTVFFQDTYQHVTPDMNKDTIRKFEDKIKPERHLVSSR